MSFKLHLVPQQGVMIVAFTALQTEQVCDLVSDLREIDRETDRFSRFVSGTIYRIFDFRSIHLSHAGVMIFFAQKDPSPSCLTSNVRCIAVNNETPSELESNTLQKLYPDRHIAYFHQLVDALRFVEMEQQREATGAVQEFH